MNARTTWASKRFVRRGANPYLKNFCDSANGTVVVEFENILSQVRRGECANDIAEASFTSPDNERTLR